MIVENSLKIASVFKISLVIDPRLKHVMNHHSRTRTFGATPAYVKRKILSLKALSGPVLILYFQFTTGPSLEIPDPG